VTPTTTVSDILERARKAIQPSMLEAVNRLGPAIRDVVTYHLGWTDANGHPSAAGGKGVRPALAMLSAEAAWADAGVGIPGGVAVELVHNFSLIHDDLMDGDLERHHRPTVWALWGAEWAVIAGDALASLATQVLLSAGNPAGSAAAAALSEATAEMIAGQAEDLAFERRRHVSIESCMAMSTAKTGALLGCAASIGAILAAAPPATTRALRDYGRHLGVAFQAVDDLLGIWGDPAVTGKPVGNDIRQRKKSMPIVAALCAGDDESKELMGILYGDGGYGGGSPSGSPGDGGYGGGNPSGSPGDGGYGGGDWPAIDEADLAGNGSDFQGARAKPLSEESLERATRLIEACGGRDWTAARAKAHLDAALGSLERARLSAVPRRALADLALFVVERES